MDIKTEEEFSLVEILEMEDYIMLVSSGNNDPSLLKFSDDVPQNLIDAWRDSYHAKQKLKDALKESIAKCDGLRHKQEG